MGGSDAAISPEQDVLDQLDWLIAELEAQRPFLVRIPDVQLTARPLADQPSLIGFYQNMLVREKASLSVLSLDPPVPLESAEDIDPLLGAIVQCRSVLLTALRNAPADSWQLGVVEASDQTLLQWAFQITLDDGETLRSVAERLHESQLSLGGSRADGP